MIILSNSKEVFMTQRKFSGGLMIALIVGVFGLGFVCGSMAGRHAGAQMGGLLEGAGKVGGAVGAGAEVGVALVVGWAQAAGVWTSWVVCNEGGHDRDG